jgi:chloramphenicol O-acetyltransferase type A
MYKSAFEAPFYSISCNIDITNIFKFAKKNNLSVFKTLLYVIARSVNSVQELNYRINGDKVFELDCSHPKFTHLSNDGVFTFCIVDFNEDFQKFYVDTEKEMKKREIEPLRTFNHNRDDLINITCVPWVSFSHINFSYYNSPIGTPHITIGKFYSEFDKTKLPLTLHVNHALVDGYHVGLFFNGIESLANLLIENYMNDK